jgi:hypothetical protein
VTKVRDALLAATGLVLFALVARRIGGEALVRETAALRVGLPIIVILSVVRLVLQTRSWKIALALDGIRSSTSELIFIRLASQGIGYLTVLGPAVSEPLKINLLRNRFAYKPRSAAAATLVDTGVYWFSSGLVGVAGCLAAGVLLSHSQHSVITVVILGAAFAAGLYLLARPTTILSPWVDALGIRCPGWLKKAEQIEGGVRRFAREHPSAIRQMLLLDLACQTLLAAEVVAIFWCLRLPFHGGTVLALEAASRMVKMLTGWMPARIGADESGAVGAFVALGLPAASGLALALTRRARDLLSVLVGLTWFAWHTQSVRRSPQRQARQISASNREQMICKP